MGFIKRGLQPILRRLPIHRVTPQIVELKQDGLLQGRTALVTGGTSGIGRAIAIAFLKAGAVVVITGRNQNRVDDTVRNMKNEIGNDIPVYGLELNMKNVSTFGQKVTELLAVVPSKK